MHGTPTGQHLISQSVNTPSLMDSEGSLPCSQKPVTGNYPEPEESNPHTHFLLGMPIYFSLSFLIKILYAFVGLVGTHISYFVLCSGQNSECTHTNLSIYERPKMRFVKQHKDKKG